MPLLSCFCFHSFQEVFNYKIAARPERRRQFEKELTSQIEVALNILTACLKINELKEQVKFFLMLHFSLSSATKHNIFYYANSPLIDTVLKWSFLTYGST